MKTYLVRIRERSSIKNLLRERSELKNVTKNGNKLGLSCAKLRASFNLSCYSLHLCFFKTSVGGLEG